MIEGRDSAEQALASAARDLAQIEYELGLLAERAKLAREDIDRVLEEGSRRAAGGQ